MIDSEQVPDRSSIIGWSTKLASSKVSADGPAAVGSSIAWVEGSGLASSVASIDPSACGAMPSTAAGRSESPVEAAVSLGSLAIGDADSSASGSAS
jgi:hypothetical protein